MNSRFIRDGVAHAVAVGIAWVPWGAAWSGWRAAALAGARLRAVGSPAGAGAAGVHCGAPGGAQHGLQRRMGVVFGLQRVRPARPVRRAGAAGVHCGAPGGAQHGLQRGVGIAPLSLRSPR